jgi:uncharacterized protein
LVPLAKSKGLACVIDGANADDLGDYRPGAAAAREWNVESPLADLGFTKSDIRTLSKSRGIPTWQQPSAPCLSSRIPYGTRVSPMRLRLIEHAESALRSLGVTGDLRVRFHGELARIELPQSDLTRWLEPEAAEQLRAAVVSAGFTRVAVDVRGFRSGSLNVLGGVVRDDASRVPTPNDFEAPAA